ncbi:hypothetical protein PISMIDRAFT_96864 [Pisolithus microcarpus 441]|uniref:Uncharacterized protein n=1 Tax=Pisolithus microcarpus 441 TaxID=765257 RepID=A0A0C9YKB5_9AGAM|nr:hypothetical protein PISMIDRAFT_96864 [Pisolithus microcarpus 441]
MLPHLDPPENTNPHASADLGNGYILLAKRDRYLTAVRGEEERVIAEYLGLPFAPKICRWACLRLPNGQIARSEYQELQKAPEDIRMSRNVKVRYFARLIIRVADEHAALDADIASPDRFHFADVALVTAYSQPHTDLLEKSYGVLASCMKPAQPSLQVIKISDIRSVVAMIPHCPIIHGVAEERYFLVEKSGMEIARFGVEDDEE